VSPGTLLLRFAPFLSRSEGEGREPHAKTASTRGRPRKWRAGCSPYALGQSSGPPYVWTWIGTPVITGTHVYTFTADGLDVPARGLVFAGGSAVYLPVIFKQ